MACELLNATTFMALSVVNDLKVIMPSSLPFSMYLSFLEMVEGHQLEHRYAECSPSKPKGSDEVNMFNNCHTIMTDIVQCF